MIAGGIRLSSGRMELADFIRLGCEPPPLRFLVIGGYAVAAHGHTRATFERMWQASEERDFGGSRARVPCLDLNLPDGEGIRSFPPRVSLAELIQRNRQLRRWFPSGLRRPEERWQAKTAVEFRL